MASNRNPRTSSPGSYTTRSLKQINTPGLSYNGKNWLTRALDPFHDNVSVPKAGLPDFTPNATLIKEHTRAVTVTKPATVADGENWVCAMFTTPNLNTQAVVKASMFDNGNIIVGASDDVIQFDTVTILTWPESEGDDWFIEGTANDLVDGLESHGVSLYENGTTGVGRYLSRLIGGGFEVANTTSSLYKQGNVISACAPQVLERSSLGNLQVGGSGANTGSPAFTCRLPPTSAAEVRANPNSVSWEAEHGVYVPFRMDHMKNPFGMLTNIPMVFTTSESGETQVMLSNTESPSVNGLFPNVLSKPHLCPLAQNVTFFTGLSSQTALTVNVRFLEEVAPVSDLDLLAFGPEVYDADPLAIEMYQRALMKLPVAVTFAENASAEFWARVVKTLGSVAAPVAGAIAGPVGTGVINTLTNVISEKLEKKAQQQKNTKTQAVAAKQQQKVANSGSRAKGKSKQKN